MHYILVSKEVVPIDDQDMWRSWFATADRHVAYTDVSDDISVSTVFVGQGSCLFETCVFTRDTSLVVRRYDTWEDALAGHAEVVCEARSA